MSGFTVDYRALLDQARKIFDEADKYSQTAKTMKAAADQLASCWEGPASKRFKDEQEAMYTWYEEMAAICRDYGEKATVAAVRYMDAEAAAKAAIEKH